MYDLTQKPANFIINLRYNKLNEIFPLYFDLIRWKSIWQVENISFCLIDDDFEKRTGIYSFKSSSRFSLIAVFLNGPCNRIFSLVFSYTLNFYRCCHAQQKCVVIIFPGLLLVSIVTRYRLLVTFVVIIACTQFTFLKEQEK